MVNVSGCKSSQSKQSKIGNDTTFQKVNHPTDEDTELRDLVAQTLHQQGILSKIKAQLRSSIFLALDEHELGKIDQSKSPLINEKLKQFLETKEGLETVSIVRNFLQFFDLDYTLAVFEPELNHIDSSQFLGAEELSEAYQLGPSASSTDPLLVRALRQQNISPLSQSRPSKKPDPPQTAPTAKADYVNTAAALDLEDSLDKKDGLMGSFSYEESPRSPRKPLSSLNNFGDGDSSPPIGEPAVASGDGLGGKEPTRPQLFEVYDDKNLVASGGGRSIVSDLYEDDFGSSTNSANLPKTSARSAKGNGGVMSDIMREAADENKSEQEISEDLEDQEEDDLEEELSEEGDEGKENDNRNSTKHRQHKETTDITSDHSVSRLSDTEAEIDYIEDNPNLKSPTGQQ